MFAGAPILFGVAYSALLLGVYEYLGADAAIGVVFGAAPILVLLLSHEEWLTNALGLVPMHRLEEAVEHAKDEARVHTSTNDENLDWANLLIDELWPHIAKYTEALMHSFEPTLQEKLHVPVRFKSCSLGRHPIRLGPIKAHVIGGYVEGVYKERAGLELQVGVDYKSDVDVVLSTMLASIGVANLTLSGTLSVFLRPFLDKAPFIGGLEIVFTNPPEVQIDFTGLANVADMPGVHGAVRRVLNDIIAKKLVIPHRIAVPISSDKAVDVARLKHPPPQGVLRLKIISAENLAAADMSVFSQATSDPYVQIQVGGEQWQTPVIKQNCNPRWTKDNEHDFVVYSLDQWVQVDVWDWDMFTASDSLGSLNHLPVEQLIGCAGKGPVPFDLQARLDEEEAPPAGARLFVKVEWFWLDQALDDVAEDVEGNRFLVTVKIDECLGLREHPSLHPPYCVRVRTQGSDVKRALTTSRGYAKILRYLTMEDVQHIRDLADEGLTAPAIAKNLKLDAEFVWDYLAARGASSSSCQEDLADRRLLEKLQARRDAVGTACNPHFEEVLTLPIQSKDEVLLVELIDDPARRKRGEDGIVGRFEVRLSSDQVIEGPFSFKDPSTGRRLTSSPDARLSGTVTVWRMKHAEEHGISKFRGVAKLLGLQAQGAPHRGGSALASLRARPTKKSQRSREGSCFPFLNGVLW